ncbi:hypothetical protein EIN_479240 [Entamoeba invadens IP1]|uniref:Furin repeat-containing protein n=1 Tax=Entamoeba invadens IP1 TaxID=370355 RepID=L7FNG8_ENTIV|nr:hypothetical protein EIN_479240 [Entamoeba invadens IP1]ELP93715.1 hypothetical protein EIN_479240 [Entamoeba invadens IP1]|eukprot:XP_004260486.1 hypothetical protein EIN_479240 [Entamoeba invadens IP1]
MNGNKCDDCSIGKITSRNTCDTTVNACGSGSKCAACVEVTKKQTIKCTKCATQTDYINLDETCDKTCKTGKANKETMNCEKCAIGGCETCETVASAEQCTKCENKYIATDKISCVNKCTTGKSVDTPIKKCDMCATSNCVVCDKDDKCTKCKTDFNLVSDNLKCVEKCPEGYNTDKTNKKCIKCVVEGCATCEKVDECTACMAEYKLEGGKCSGAHAISAIMAMVVMAFLF